MRSRRRLLAGAGAVLAGGMGVRTVADRATSPDWPMARYDAAGTGYNPDASGPTDGVQIAWQHEATSPLRGRGSSPILHGGTLYAAGQGLVALAADTGEVEFRHDGAYGSSPARAEAGAYRTPTLAVASPEGIAGLNAGGGYGLPLTGQPFGADRWRASHGAGSGLRRPAAADGVVLAVGYAGELGAYDADTGEVLWREPTDLLTPHAPTVAGGAVVVPGRTAVRAFDREDGAVRWTYDHGGNAHEDAAAAVADGRVFVADGEGSLQAIDLESGEGLWSAPFGGVAAPVVGDDTVYLARRAPGLVAFDAADGERRWRVGAEWAASRPIVGDGRLYVLGTDRVTALEEGTDG